MFGKSKNRQQPKLSTVNRLGELGALMMDFGGSTQGAHGAARAGNQQRLAQMAQQQQQQRQQQLIAQMTGGQGGAQGGMSPQMMAAAQMNPQAVAEAMAKQRFGHHTVNGGNSVVTYGPNGQPQMTQAAENFQNGSRVATVGPNGNSSFDMGQNQAEANTQFANQSTRQNNLATQELGRGKLDELIRNNTMTDENTDYSNLTGRMNANTAREKAQFAAANPTSDLGKSPLYLQDADGNVQIGQLGNGQIVKAQTPEGLSVMSPYERSFTQSQGRTAGKTQGEAAAGLGGAELRTQQALDTVEKLRTHPGLGAGTGRSSFIPSAISGDDRRAFDALASQAKGQTFMQAFESLKGGGQITEIESAQASQAIARLNQSQSEADYVDALNDLESILQRGINVSREKAGVQTGGLSAQEEAELAELEKMYGG